MFQNNWKTEILTLPNLLSLFRLVLIPVYTRLYLQAVTPAQYYMAGALMALSCMTDALDGKIARKFHMISTLGKFLDPLADKITQLVLILCLSIRYPVLKPVLGLFMIKELFQLALAAFSLCQGKILPGALPAGKICTCVLFFSLIMLVIFPDIPASLVNAIAVTDGIFLTVSFFCYLLAYWGRHSMLQDLNPDEQHRC